MLALIQSVWAVYVDKIRYHLRIIFQISVLQPMKTHKIVLLKKQCI